VTNVLGETNKSSSDFGGFFAFDLTLIVFVLVSLHVHNIPEEKAKRAILLLISVVVLPVRTSSGVCHPMDFSAVIFMTSAHYSVHNNHALG
jgi:hypothetical protein